MVISHQDKLYVKERGERQSNMKIYHVAVDSSTAEIEVLRQVKPPRLLLSYFYFRNKPLKAYINKLGYRPEILFDSGAWSAYNKGKDIALTSYMKCLKGNKEFISRYFSLDVCFDPELSWWYYKIMVDKGFKPIPVYHYGTDEKWLRRYVNESKFIGLGGTVPVTNKSDVADWVRMIIWQYPEIEFHLLGSSSQKIFNTCDISSMDSSSYFKMAVNGYPQHIKGRSRESKIERAIYNLQRELEIARCL